MVKKTNLTLIMTVILFCLGLPAGYAEEGTVIAEYRYGGLELRESYVILTAQKAFFGNLYTSRVPPSLTEINAYTIREEQAIPFLIRGEENKQFIILWNDEVCYLFKNSRIAPYKGAEGPVYVGLEKSECLSYVLTPAKATTASSFLKEPATATRPRMDYAPENLERFGLDAPWVENAPGAGIGQKVRFSVADDDGEFAIGKTVGFYIFNGFISFERPDLYKKNSRVKKIKMTDVKTNKSRVIALQDTPNPQFIDINDFAGTEVELEIVEVYPGTHYEDTCIGGIVLKRLRK
jgi:hypothetical protein